MTVRDVEQDESAHVSTDHSFLAEPPMQPLPSMYHPVTLCHPRLVLSALAAQKKPLFDATAALTTCIGP